MTKRDQWYLTCVLFAVFWGVVGLFFIPFWFFSVVSLLMMIIPVGVDNHPTPNDDARKWEG